MHVEVSRRENFMANIFLLADHMFIIIKYEVPGVSKLYVI